MWEFYDERTREYDAWYDEHPDIYLREIDMLSIETPRPRLEIGAGTGRFAGPLGYEYGLDPSGNSLVLAQSRGVTCVLGVGEHLPFEDGSIGTVLICMSLWLFEDRATALAEVARVLAPGGRLIAAMVPADSPLGREYARRRNEDPDSFYGNAWLLTRKEIVELLTGTGFEVVDERSAGLETPDAVAFICRKAGND